MAYRLRKNFDERNRMLLGISHDLRTPLTRMKLQLHLMPDFEDKNDFLKDISEMKQMIEGYLSFAQGEDVEEIQRVKLEKFLKKVLDKTSFSKMLVTDFSVPADFMVYIKPLQFQRCLNNLLENCQRYAKEIISIQVYTQKDRSGKDTYILVIEDDGPGIDACYYKDIFDPFFRIDTSRHLEWHNVGLGLSVVKTVVLSHCGTIEVGRSRWGGASFSLYFPV